MYYGLGNVLLKIPSMSLSANVWYIAISLQTIFRYYQKGYPQKCITHGSQYHVFDENIIYEFRGGTIID